MRMNTRTNEQPTSFSTISARRITLLLVEGINNQVISVEKENRKNRAFVEIEVKVEYSLKSLFRLCIFSCKDKNNQFISMLKTISIYLLLFL